VDPSRAARLIASIRHELDACKQIAAEAAANLQDFQTQTPSLLQLRGLGDIVHDFYTGIERIFGKIATETDGGLPGGSNWHRELVETMSFPIGDRRPTVITSATAGSLEEYLRFRHLFRNLYGFQLQWGRLKPLLERLPSVFETTRKDLEAFITFLERFDT